jgi:hypothetical protein
VTESQQQAAGAFTPAAPSVTAVTADARVEHWRSAQHALKWATAGSLLVTSALGTIAAINNPTWFGPGRCASMGEPIFGTYGCNHGFSTLHGIAGVTSVIFYTANGVLVLSLPKDPDAPTGAKADWDHSLTYVHLTGIIAQPLLGLIAAYPQVVGVPAQNQDQFSKTMRTIHVGVGAITTAAFLTTAILEE